jgi:uncharacterized protein
MLLAFSAHDIDAAGLAVDVALPSAWLDAELADAALTAKAPGRITGRLSRSGNEIVVRARVRTNLTTPCARCLEPAAVDVDTELSLMLRPAAPAPPAAKSKAKDAEKAKAAEKAKKPSKSEPKLVEYEFTSAEADTDAFDGETVVLDPFVREAILLEAPNFPLCSEGCPGIRPAAAAPSKDGAAHVDPRLAPLAAMMTATPKTTKKKNKE